MRPLKIRILYDNKKHKFSKTILFFKGELIMTISPNRPSTSMDTASMDIKKFISYLKGESEQNETMPMPNSLSDYITDKIRVFSPIKSLAKVTYTSNDRLDVVAETEDTNQSGWVVDNAIKCDDKNTISKISIHLHELFAKPKVTHSLLEDHSAKVEEFVRDKITSQMAASENKAFLFGDGINQPKGILTYEISTDGPKAKCIEAEIGGEPGKLDSYEPLVKLMEKLPSK